MTPSSSGANQGPEDLHEPSILFTDLGFGVQPPTDGRRAETGHLGGGTARKLLRREDVPKLRSGWYAYRVTGAATLPSWAVEVALSVERPVESHPTQRLASQDDEAVPPWPPEPGAPDATTFPAAGSPCPGEVRPRGRAADPKRRYGHESHPVGRAVQVVVLLRAPGWMSCLADLAEAAAEVEAAAGMRTRWPSLLEIRSRLSVGTGRACSWVRRFPGWCRSRLPLRSSTWRPPGREVFPRPGGAGRRRRVGRTSRGERAQAAS